MCLVLIVSIRPVDARTCEQLTNDLKLALDVAIDLRRKEFSAAEELPPSAGVAGELNLHDLPFVRSRIAEVSGVMLATGTAVSLPCGRRYFEDGRAPGETASADAHRALDVALARRRTGNDDSGADLLRIAFLLVEFVVSEIARPGSGGDARSGRIEPEMGRRSERPQSAISAMSPDGSAPRSGPPVSIKPRVRLPCSGRWSTPITILAPIVPAKSRRRSS